MYGMVKRWIFRGCLEDVWKVSVRCLKIVWNPSIGLKITIWDLNQLFLLQKWPQNLVLTILSCASNLWDSVEQWNPFFCTILEPRTIKLPYIQKWTFWLRKWHFLLIPSFKNVGTNGKQQLGMFTRRYGKSPRRRNSRANFCLRGGVQLSYG